MKNRRQLLFRAGTLLLVLVLAAAMFVIGRGHTVYFDNKTAEYGGQEYPAFHHVDVIVDGVKAAKLDKRDRGMTDTMGQNFTMTLEITDEKGAEPHAHKVSLRLPYGMDGILINLPELMAGLPEEAWLSELEIAVPESDSKEEAPAGGDMDPLGITPSEN